MAMKNPPHVGEFIRAEILEEFDLNITDTAETLDVRRATLSELVNGRSQLTAEMALRIEKAFGVDMDMLLRMQAAYDAAQIRLRADDIDVKPHLAAA